MVFKNSLILIQNKNELFNYFLEYLDEEFDGLIYCVDEELYQILYRHNYRVDKVYLYEGLLYNCMGEVCVSPVLYNSHLLTEQFNRHNRANTLGLDSWSIFVDNYTQLLTQEEYLQL